MNCECCQEKYLPDELRYFFGDSEVSHEELEKYDWNLAICHECSQKSFILLLGMSGVYSVYGSTSMPYRDIRNVKETFSYKDEVSLLKVVEV